MKKHSEEARLHIEAKLHDILVEARSLGVQVESVHYDAAGSPETSYSISADEIGRWAKAPNGRKHAEPLLIVNIDHDA